jgi:hypothetical protein
MRKVPPSPINASDNKTPTIGKPSGINVPIRVSVSNHAIEGTRDNKTPVVSSALFEQSMRQPKNKWLPYVLVGLILLFILAFWFDWI